MPLYEYLCPKCGDVFEELRKSVNDGEAPCPRCGETSKRIISNTAFALKGGGWHATEYKDRRPEFMQRAGRPKIKGSTVEPAVASGDGGQSKPEAAAKPAGSGKAKAKSAAKGVS
jgi:putative FmdB family regulatory protein